MAAEKRKTKGTADPVDVHVGNRLKARRALMGWSQEKLGSAIDLTFQQIQKYEQGMNRISSGKLYQISQIMNVPVTYFFDGYDDGSTQPGFSDNEQSAFVDDRVINDKETLELVRTFTSIKDPEVRKNALRLLKSIASQDDK